MIAERVTFESQDVTLSGRLVLPDSGIAMAGVLCITGGGTSDCDTPYLEWQEQMANEGGLASLAFNARGMGDSGGSFRTDDPGFNEVTSPANSQATRTEDTVVAFDQLKRWAEIADDERLGVIGGSMGGDIALHAATINPGALVLRAPSAYPEGAHEVPYGPGWGPEVRRLGGNEAALKSPNFKRIGQLGRPLLLIYSHGDTTIPKEVQLKYLSSVEAAGGMVEFVGDRSTKHKYINDRVKPEEDNETNRLARARTYIVSTRFFSRHLASTH